MESESIRLNITLPKNIVIAMEKCTAPRKRSQFIAKAIQDRIVGRFVNEAVKCVEDEIIESPMVGDIGMVFGTGFAPFRGGPFRYLDQVGVSNFVDQMNRLADQYGPQFEPCQLLKDYAASGKKFHKN